MRGGHSGSGGQEIEVEGDDWGACGQGAVENEGRKTKGKVGRGEREGKVGRWRFGQNVVVGREHVGVGEGEGEEGGGS